MLDLTNKNPRFPAETVTKIIDHSAARPQADLDLLVRCGARTTMDGGSARTVFSFDKTDLFGPEKISRQGRDFGKGGSRPERR
jgi:hypothetical protein